MVISTLDEVCVSPKAKKSEPYSGNGNLLDSECSQVHYSQTKRRPREGQFAGSEHKRCAVHTHCAGTKLRKKICVCNKNSLRS